MPSIRYQQGILIELASKNIKYDHYLYGLNSTLFIIIHSP